MSGAAVMLAVNIAVAAVFVFGHAIIAVSNRTQRAALGFSVAYTLGLLSPLCDLLMPWVGAGPLLEWSSFTTFMAALLSISIAFCHYHGRTPTWVPALAGAIFIIGLILRALIWEVPRGTLAFAVPYQLPFAAAAVLQAAVVLIEARRRPLYVMLVPVCLITAVHFMMKPLVAVHFGQGTRLEDYTQTTYALLSQASTGILLLISGVMLLLIVAQNAITASHREAETDPLSGLLNRRGFDARADKALACARRQKKSLSVVLFDLDHFKSINDRFGHDVGDEAIVQFALMLRKTAPGSAVLARMGGEEFVMLLEGVSAEAAALYAEAIRLNAEASHNRSPSSPTVSSGVAAMVSSDTRSTLMRRADMACYQAKQNGRNQICCEVMTAESPISNVILLKR